MEKFAETVYDTVCGQLLPAFQVPGVMNLFEAGMLCDRCYEAAMDAYSRVKDRLGAEDEDPDCEEILRSLLEIQKQVGIAMFLEGYRFGKADSSLYAREP